MAERKLSIYISTFPYAGNSTGSSLTWPTAVWLIQSMHRLKSEEKFTSRVGDVFLEAFADTPITMTRNAAVREAQSVGADILVMLDSDMQPDCQPGDEDFVPFLDAAFDRIYSKYDEGPRVVGAPYMGTPPFENAFIFSWTKHGNGMESPFELRQYTREECIYLSGIQEAAALPTGLIMYDMRCFDLIDAPYFSYEWTDNTESQKASTEDVQNTRDISLAGCRQLGYNPVECAWSSWAGHLKNSCVRKPLVYTAKDVSENLANALSRPDSREKLVQTENMLGNVREIVEQRNRLMSVDQQPQEKQMQVF